MKVRLKSGLVIVSAESAPEAEALAAWAKEVDGHVFALRLQDERTFRLSDLGPRPQACREPINVTSRSPDMQVRLISNFANTPFELDGRGYASVEAFWQGLKFADEARRRQIASSHGLDARHAGADAPKSDTFQYEGRTIRAGSPDHWRLMELACRAKFNQHEPAKQALRATGERPLTHRTRKDSRTIPGAIMAEIWMRIRAGIAPSR